jgi:hypothetical protein
MRKMLFVLLALAGTLGVGGQDVSACGDKFLLAGRGARFQRGYCAIHPASILVYANPKSGRAAAMGDPQFLNALKQAGHKPQMIAELGKFDDLIASGRYDIVLADFADAAVLEQHLKTTPSKSLLLPVMYKPSTADVAAATQHYGAVLKAPDKITHFLNVIDDVMKARQAGIRASTFG